MKIVTQSLSDQVYLMVKSEILKGNLKMGERISEDALAEQFGVSRTPIREAMRRLSEYGIINLAPRSHASITKIGIEDAMDIAELRIDLELFGIDHIREELFMKDLEEISRSAAECLYAISIGDKARAFEFDSTFHVGLMKATGNQALVDTYTRLDAKIQLLRIEQDLDEKTLVDYLAQHNELIQLLKAGRKDEAKELIREHISHASLS